MSMTDLTTEADSSDLAACDEAELEETDRQLLLGELGVLDTPPERAFDDLVRIAARLCATPIALVTLLDPRRQWFKARFGLDQRQAPRAHAPCAHAVLEPSRLMVVEDASQDPRFAGAPLVAGQPHLRFYAGAPLVLEEGIAVGTLCVYDSQPRRLDDDQREGLSALARQVICLLELRRRNRKLEALSSRLILAQRELQLANAMLTQDMLTDPLTGLANRRALENAIDGFAQGGHGNEGCLSVAMLDVDHFKAINDSFGHAAGDEVLRNLGTLVRRLVRGMDIACRYGGEEILLLLPDTPLAAARTVVQRICDQARRMPYPAPFTLSVGLASGRIERDAIEHLIECADQALYRAKRGGRNRVEVIEDV